MDATTLFEAILIHLIVLVLQATYTAIMNGRRCFRCFLTVTGSANGSRIVAIFLFVDHAVAATARQATRLSIITEEFLQRSLKIERSAGDTRRQAATLANLFRVHAARGDLEDAFDSADRAVALSIQIHDWYAAAVSKRSKARFLRRRNREDEARKELTEAAALFNRAGLADEEQAVEQEIERLGKKVGFPWYIRALFIMGGLFFLLMMLGVLLSLFEGV